MIRLSASSITNFLKCQRAFYYSNILRIEKIEKSEALNFGSAFHKVLEARLKGADLEDALKFVKGENLNEQQQSILIELARGYYFRYKEDPLFCADFQPELSYNKRTPGVYKMCDVGTIDGYGRLEDNRFCLLEHKTTSDSISPDSEYWQRLQFNIQILNYVDILNQYKMPLHLVVYDVIKKPGLRVRQNENLENFQKRLKKDIESRPDFYFARREVPILSDSLAEFRSLKTEIIKQIKFCVCRQHKHKDNTYRAWVRNCNIINCKSCEFAQFCLVGGKASLEEMPTGYTVKK